MHGWRVQGQLKSAVYLVTLFVVAYALIKLTQSGHQLFISVHHS